MFAADQLVAHAVGDYLLQSDWMANNKARRLSVAGIHALVYSLPFLLLHPSAWAWLVIIWSHIFIDRYRLARYACWAKNGFPRPLTDTGYPIERPAYMAVWLLIILDNICHVLINGAALRWL